jgi:hypothetical protein
LTIYAVFLELPQIQDDWLKDLKAMDPLITAQIAPIFPNARQTR